MKLELYVARRFASSLRKDRFSLFTSATAVVSIALGCLAVCLAVSILGGYSNKIVETATQFTSHIVLRSQVTTEIDDATELMRHIAGNPLVHKVDPILERESLLKHKGELDGVMIHGVTSGRLFKISSLVTTPLNKTDVTRGLVLGEGVAKSLHVTTGDSVTCIMRQRGVREPLVRRLLVAAIFRSGMGSQDDNLALIHIDSLRTFAGLASHSCSAVLVELTDDSRLDAATDELRSTYKSSLSVQTYKDVFQGIWGWIELQRRPIPIVLGLIVIVAVVSIVSTLFLTIVQKTRSIAILSTLGMTPAQIGRIVVMRALLSGVLGVLTGLAVTVGFVVLQSRYGLIRLDSNLYYVSVLPVSLNLPVYAAVATGVLTLIVFVSLIPVGVARRISPAQALRFS